MVVRRYLVNDNVIIILGLVRLIVKIRKYYSDGDNCEGGSSVVICIVEFEWGKWDIFNLLFYKVKFKLNKIFLVY